MILDRTGVTFFLIFIKASKHKQYNKNKAQTHQQASTPSRSKFEKCKSKIHRALFAQHSRSGSGRCVVVNARASTVRPTLWAYRWSAVAPLIRYQPDTNLGRCRRSIQRRATMLQYGIYYIGGSESISKQSSTYDIKLTTLIATISSSIRLWAKSVLYNFPSIKKCHTKGTCKLVKS